MKPTTDPTSIGANRTGVGAAPRESQRSREGARDGVPQASFDMAPITAVRVDSAQEAEPVGTLPVPATAKGLATTLKEGLKGEKAAVLLDLLGERLAFERTGTRLYDAALAKLAAAHVHESGPAEEDLEDIRDDELSHVAMLSDAIARIGGDPTAVTPGADTVAVASEGLVKVLTDPRTTLTQALKALLMAELADNDGWASLIELAYKMEQRELVDDCRAALGDEERHLGMVREWVASAIEGQAGVADEEGPTAVSPAPPGAE
jgi:hypothetical protein